MRRASGEEFIKALARTETHTQARTAGEFLMSEDLTGDTEVETGGQEGWSSRTETERRSGEKTALPVWISPLSVSVCVCVCTLC